MSLKLLTDSISKSQIGADKAATELAIKRLKKEMLESDQAMISVRRKQKSEIESMNKRLFLIGQAFIFIKILIPYSQTLSYFAIIYLMNRKQTKILTAIFTKPTLADINFSDIENCWLIWARKRLRAAARGWLS